MAPEYPEVRVDAPNRVKQIREALGMTQQALADRAGITKRGLRAIELGESAPGIDTALRITKQFTAVPLTVEYVFPIGGRKVRRPEQEGDR
jgi:DNA-binding XRE family transcriptional regulator